MSSAARISPRVASENMSSVGSTPSAAAKPSVSNADPLLRKAAYHDEMPRAQYIPMYPTRTRASQTGGRLSKLKGAYSSSPRSRSR